MANMRRPFHSRHPYSKAIAPLMHKRPFSNDPMNKAALVKVKHEDLQNLKP